MHSTQAMLVIAALLIGSASAGCYTDGASWPDKDDAYSKLDSVCEAWKDGEIGDGVDGGNTRSQCRDSKKNGIRYNFQVSNSGGGYQHFGHDYCVEKLRAEIHGCDHGGKSTYGVLTFS